MTGRTINFNDKKVAYTASDVPFSELYGHYCRATGLKGKMEVDINFDQDTVIRQALQHKDYEGIRADMTIVFENPATDLVKYEVTASDGGTQTVYQLIRYFQDPSEIKRTRGIGLGLKNFGYTGTLYETFSNDNLTEEEIAGLIAHVDRKRLGGTKPPAGTKKNLAERDIKPKILMFRNRRDENTKAAAHG